ncbi:MAG: YlbE-like family protein [Bacilli bacterium]
MTTDVQLKINADMRLKRYIRENPIWYKRLNRNPDLFRNFTMEMKDKYKLKTSDRINKALNNISMLQTFLDVLK